MMKTLKLGFMKNKVNCSSECSVKKTVRINHKKIEICEPANPYNKYSEDNSRASSSESSYEIFNSKNLFMSNSLWSCTQPNVCRLVQAYNEVSLSDWDWES